MKKRRTVAVVTGSRAEFGLLTPVIRAIDAHPRLQLKLVVTGPHLTTGTWKDVASRFRIDAKVPMQRRGVVGRDADVAALGRGVAGLGKAFAAMEPDFVVVLGDRIEAFAAASAASVGGIRVVHLHGGDRAEGVADEAMRHAISKLSHIHFPAAALSRKRLIRMGEPAWLAFNVGSPAVDGIADALRGEAPDVPEVGRGQPYLIVLQHPVGAGDAQEFAWMKHTLAAVADWPHVVLMPNSDPGSAGIQRAIRGSRARVITHLPREAFLRLVKGAAALVGNSSAGLIEAAVLRVPAVNVGPRQAGRERAGNVVDCDEGTQSVRRAIRKALRLDLRNMTHPYGDGRTGERVARILAAISLDRVPVRKRNSY